MFQSESHGSRYGELRFVVHVAGGNSLQDGTPASRWRMGHDGILIVIIGSDDELGAGAIVSDRAGVFGSVSRCDHRGEDSAAAESNWIDMFLGAVWWASNDCADAMDGKISKEQRHLDFAIGIADNILEWRILATRNLLSRICVLQSSQWSSGFLEWCGGFSGIWDWTVSIWGRDRLVGLALL